MALSRLGVKQVQAIMDAALVAALTTSSQRHVLLSSLLIHAPSDINCLGLVEVGDS